MRNLLLAISCFVMASPIGAQVNSSAAQGPVLTLEQALEVARQNNPAFRTAQNSRRVADAQVKSAYGSFLPSINSSFGGDFREGRQQIVSGQAFGSTNDQLSTSVSLSTGLSFSMASLNNLRSQKASAAATESEIEAAEQNLRQQLTTQFIAARQAEARAVLQDTLLATTSAQLQLAQARLTVGSGTQLDVQRAEVQHGRQRVAALRERNNAEIELLRVYQIMGISPVAGTRLDGPTSIDLPNINLQDILSQAERANPSIDAARQREIAASRGVSAARSGYLPSINLQASVSGFTQRFTNTDILVAQGQASALAGRASCIRSEEVRAAVSLPNSLAECESMSWTAAQEQGIRDQQGKYPFDFTRNPYSISASISLPIFDRFQRESNIQSAVAQRRNAENSRREQELRVATEVTAAWNQLSVSRQTVELQEENSRTARVALSLAEERYRAGAINLVELIQARTDFETAETDRITAIFDFQRAFTQLEAAVGRPLR